MIIAPSVLSFDYANFKEDIDILNNNKNVSWLHFDVMDGHFVPNLSFGPDILKHFRRNTSLFLDVHLMVDNPKKMADIFIDAGADGITFHYEVFNDVAACLELINYLKSKFVKVGISIKPNTNVEVLNDLLAHLDTILIMSVEPGFGGQEFMPNSLDKISYLDKQRRENEYKYLIEVDGGVNDKNAHDLINVGTDILVAGSFIFKGDIEANINKLIHTK